MANKKGLDGYFIKYGISQMDLKIIEDACEAAGVDNDWVQEEILKPYQTRRNSGYKMTVESAYKIIDNALNKL